MAVPPKELFVLPGLEKYIGCRIGLLRTDIPHRPLCARLEEQTKRHEYDSIKEGIGREADGEVLA